MVPQEATVAARAAAVMVRVHGPDPKGRKMWNHVFHHSESGDTTLSASGWLLHDGSRAVERDSSIVVLTCATIVEPFLQKAPLPGGSTTQFQRTPILIPHAEVDILIEDFEQSQLHGQANDGPHHDSKHSSSWIPAKLVGLVDIPLAGTALQALLDAHGGSLDGAWEIGWALAHVETSRLQGPNPLSHKKSDQAVLSKSYDLHAVTDRESIIDNMASATTRIAVLSMHTPKMKIMPGMVLAKPCKRGDFLLVVGSPFGALSPLHFFNSMVVGIIANCWPPASPQASLLMADLRCLPGMEGAPAFNGDGAFIGMLTTPLRQRGGGAEVQLVITWEALAPALRDIGIDLQACFPEVHNDYATPSSCEERVIKAPRSLGQREGLHGSRHHVHLSPSIDETVGSVVLVTVGDGAWASGVLVNDKGLILTNAHLLEPWRFGKTQFSQSQGERGLAGLANASQIEDLRSSRRAISTCMAVSDSSKGFEKLIEKIDMPFSVGNLGLQTNEQADELVNYAANDGVVVQPALEINYRSYRKIRVRLEHPIPRTWYDARAVYVSRGPLDIALLQLGTVLAGLRPIKPEEEYPFPGTTAVVIGHGLFGPRSGDQACLESLYQYLCFVQVELIFFFADLCPSLSAGVVSRVVKAGSLSQLGSSPEVESPAMLETTAAVHPGASGGAVVNEHGRMIGLVTSNARHSGGTVIPHLNFSIPYAALKPIFSYASGDMKDPSSLSALGRPNEQFSAVWALVPPTPPRPTQVLPFLPKPPNTDSSTLHGQKPEPNRQKGSRFAKFLTEKKVDLFKQSQLMHDAGNDQVSKDRMNPPKTVVPGEVIHSRI